MEESDNELVDKLRRQIWHMVQAGKPIVLTTYTFSHSTEVYLEQVLTIFLEIMHQKSITDYVVYFVKELMGNAKKANIKRVYFNDKKLNIHRAEDYLQGMKTFKMDMLQNRKYYMTMQEKLRLYMRVKLWKENNAIKIEVSNNSRITTFEESRMQDKLEKGKQYVSLEDALVEAVDDIEGAGLGFIILILMMKKMGIDREQLWIEKGDSETRIGVNIPLSA